MSRKSKKTNKLDSESLSVELFKVILILLITTVINFIVQTLQSSIKSLDNNISLFISFVLFLFLLYIFREPIKKVAKRKFSWIVALGIILFVLLGLSNAVFAVTLERYTTYFLIDVSNQMDGLLSEVGPRVRLETEKIDDRLDLGLGVYGAGISGQIGCDDHYSYIEPQKKEDSLDKFQKIIDDISAITPIGDAGLQEALYMAIDQLAGKRGVHRIVVITSGLNSSCEALDREKLNEYAGMKKVNYELTIITFGELDENQIQTYQAFAYEHYIHLGNDINALPGVLNGFVESPPSRYWYSYFTSP